MSETQHLVGELKEVKYDGTLKDFIVSKLKERGYEPDSKISRYQLYESENDLIDQFYDEFYKEFVIIKGKVYEILEMDDAEPDWGCYSYRAENGRIGFNLLYYDGVCSFDEAIEEALENIK